MTNVVNNVDIHDFRVQFEKNKYGAELIKFISNPNYIAEKGSDDVNIFSPVYGCKNIPPNKLHTFFDLLENCRKENLFLNFAEKQNANSSGIVLDFDILQNNNQSLISDKDFTKICQRISQHINSIIELPDDIDIPMLIIKRNQLKEINENEHVIFKDGFHIIIPSIKINRPTKRFLIDKIREKQTVEKILKHVDIINKGEILDNCSAHFPVYFTGGAKPGKIPDSIYGIYNVNITDEDFITTTKINTDDYPDNICWEFSLNYETNKKWINKINYKNKSKYDDKIQKYNENKINIDEHTDMNESLSLLSIMNPEANLLKQYLDILPSKYYDEYEHWFKVMCAIANTNIEYKLIAEWFSRKSVNKFDKNDFDKYWDEINNSHSKKRISMLSIKYWARTESPEKYKAINKESYYEYFITKIYENDGDVGHFTVAKLLKMMFGDKFLAACNNGKPIWYEFVIKGDRMKHGQLCKWRQEGINGPSNLHNYISEKLPTLFNKSIEHMTERQNTVQEDNLRKYYARVIKDLKMSKRKLETNNFCNATISKAAHLFKDYNFLNEVDQDELTLGVGNGILYLGKQCKLISGFHEHKISLSTFVDYYPYDPNNPYIKELEKVIHEIIIEDDMYHWTLVWLGSSIDNRIKKAKAIQFQNNGSGGKSFLAEMVIAALGDYARKLSKAIILKSTNGRQSANTATPAEMDAINKRFGYISETDPNDFLDDSKFKEFISGETQTGRFLHQNQINYKVNMNLLSISNFPFNVDSFDEGTWRRIGYYTCKITFVEDRKPIGKWERKANPKIRHYNKKDEYKQAMLSILVHYYEIFINKYDSNIDNVPCPTLKRETEIYRNTQDTINRFITERAVKTSVDYECSITEIVKLYLDWYSINIGNNKKMKPSELINTFKNSRIRKYLTTSTNKELIIKGCRFTTPEDPIEDDEVYLCIKKNSKNNLKNLESSKNNSENKKKLENNIGDINNLL